MKGMLAMDDTVPTGCGTGEFDRRLHRLGARIGEEHLIEMGNTCKEPLCQNAGECGDVKLDKVGQVCVEDVFKDVAHYRMIAPERKYAPAAEQVDILVSAPIIEILALSADEADIVSDGPQDPDHLLVQELAVQGIALGFVVGEEVGNVQIHGRPHLTS